MGIRDWSLTVYQKKYLKLKDSKCKNNAITSYYSEANSSTSWSATASWIVAEMYWALKCTKNNWLGNSCENNNILNITMFPDSEIAKKFCMNRTNYWYTTNFGIAPFFKDVLKKKQFSAHLIHYHVSWQWNCQKVLYE